MGGVNSEMKIKLNEMKIKLKNGSTIETIDVESENIVRSRRGEEQLQHYSQYIDEVLKLLNLRWYQKLYIKLIYKIKSFFRRRWFL